MSCKPILSFLQTVYIQFDTKVIAVTSALIFPDKTRNAVSSKIVNNLICVSKNITLVARRFYCLEASPKGSSLERFPTLSKKKEKRISHWLSVCCAISPQVNSHWENCHHLYWIIKAFHC